ncbi:MAG: DUF481 domain-containing protein [Desulfamplus sp.]|nr:DUF481 domain-containing protein [Desulfamplus sp.]
MWNKVFRVVIWGIITICIALPINSFSQETKKEENKTQQKVEKKKEQDLSNWWTRNPLTFDPIPEDLLWHVEATYQWDRTTGNWTSDNHALGSLISLRYNRFTNNLRGNFEKKNVAKPKAPPFSEQNTNLRDSTKYDVHEDFRYALTKKSYLAPGVFYFEDDYSYIDERWTYYLGIGGDVYSFKFDDTEIFKLSMFGAYGYETKKYIDEYHETYLLVKEWGIADTIHNYDPNTEKYDVLYFNESIKLLPYYGVMVTQDLIYVVDAGDSDLYRWTFSVGVDFKIMENLFVSLSYKEEYDNNANQLLGIRPRDQTYGTGIKVVF